MYSSNLENELIIWDIENVLQDFVPIQYDIDSKKIKASQKLAIDLELTKFISKTDIASVVDMDEDSASDADKELLQLINVANLIVNQIIVNQKQMFFLHQILVIH